MAITFLTESGISSGPLVWESNDKFCSKSAASIENQKVKEKNQSSTESRHIYVAQYMETSQKETPNYAI